MWGNPLEIFQKADIDFVLNQVDNIKHQILSPENALVTTTDKKSNKGEMTWEQNLM